MVTPANNCLITCSVHACAGREQGGSGQQAPSEADAAVEEETAETAEQHMMRRTRDFNRAVRERPHDLQLWLDFAAFQDELGGCAAPPSILHAIKIAAYTDQNGDKRVQFSKLSWYLQGWAESVRGGGGREENCNFRAGSEASSRLGRAAAGAAGGRRSGDQRR